MQGLLNMQSACRLCNTTHEIIYCQGTKKFWIQVSPAESVLFQNLAFVPFFAICAPSDLWQVL